MLLVDAYGVDHSPCMIVADDFHGLIRCLVSVINVMYIIRCKGHIKSHDVVVCL